MSSESILQVTSLSTEWGLFWGFFGGICAEFSSIFKIRTALKGSFPEHLKSFSYWLITISMALLGAVLVVAYMKSGFEFKALLAINVGATAPLIFEALARKTPDLSPGSSD